MEVKKRFTALFIACEPAVRSFVQGVVRSVGATEEIMQETAVVLWEKYADATDPDTFRKLLFATAKYKILSWQRDQSRERLLFTDDAISMLADEAMKTQEAAAERQRLLDDAVSGLTVEERQLLWQSFTSSENVKTQALRQGKTPMALYKKLQKIRKKVLDTLEEKREKDS